MGAGARIGPLEEEFETELSLETREEEEVSIFILKEKRNKNYQEN